MKAKMTKVSKPKATGGKHRPSKPRLRTRHLSTISKSAFAGPDPTAAFPPGPMGGGPTPAFMGGAPSPDGGGGAPPAPMDTGAGALAGPGGGSPGVPGM